MDNQLRPLSLGEILDRTAELYRNNFLLFAGIAAIFAAAMLLIGMLHLGILALFGSTYDPKQFGGLTAAVSVVEMLAYMLAAGLSIAANNRAVAWVYLGQPATIRNAAVSILPRIRSYLWLMTMTAFRAWAPLAVLYVALFGVVFTALPKGFLTNPAVQQTAATPNPQALIALGIAALALVPLMLLSTAYGAWMSLRYSLAMPACVVEELNAGDALKRSIGLSQGSKGRIFVLGLLVYAVRMLLSMLLGMPFFILAFKHPGQPVPLYLMAIQQVGTFFVSSFIGPIYATGLTLFYYDQRIRNEGYDIEMMMHAAGLTMPRELAAPEVL